MRGDLGVLAGSQDAERCINYVAKYLTKSVDACHEVTSDRQQEDLDRLWDVLRFEPCSPTCANWLRYGVQPRHPKPGLQPGYCKGKAHRYQALQ
jgi:hypothetical protein